MPQMLLINPGRTVKKTRRKTRTAAQRAATKRMIAANRSRSGRKTTARKSRRRSNPLPAVRRVARRAARTVGRIRRRRNPISLGSGSSYLALFKDAAIQGGGAVALDVAYGYINPMLPAMLQRTPGAIGIGDAVKAVVTVALGKILSKPTRGLSMRAAKGSLTVQAHGLISGMLPAGVAVGGGRVGWQVASPVVNSTARIGPNGQVGRVGAYMPAGQTALLNGGRGAVGAYMAPGQTALLSGTAADREGWGGRR